MADLTCSRKLKRTSENILFKKPSHNQKNEEMNNKFAAPSIEWFILIPVDYNYKRDKAPARLLSSY